jgi:hypothetical protein
MGNEPLEEEIPVEFEDFPTDVQEAFLMYYKLQDQWDGFGGNYLGKNYSGIKDLFEINEIPREDWKTMFDLIELLDHYRAQQIRKTLDQKRAKNPA